MKQKLLYLLPLLLAAGMGCIKSNNIVPQPVPSGTFTGTFNYQHQSTPKGPVDSLTANVTLTMESSTNTFSVTGDTATVHAGSFGTYLLNSSYIQFVDKTFPPTGVPAKKHLSGYYLYSYDGIVLYLAATAGDTVAYQYRLKKN